MINKNKDVVNTLAYEELAKKVSLASVLHSENPLKVVEDYIQGLIRVYNDEICETIDNYNCSAYYEPTPVIVRAYYNGSF